MGQTLGRAPLLPASRHFSNLPKRLVYRLYARYSETAEGLGLTQDEFMFILRTCLKDHLEYTEKKLDLISKAVFTTLDDDENDLVDALEFISAFAVMSSMTPVEKARFVFGVFDLDESGDLSPQELALALRTTASGLCKLSDMDVPLEADIKRVAAAAFLRDRSTSNSRALARSSPKSEPFLTLAEFLTYAEASPELSAWLSFYDDLDELDVPVLKSSDLDELCELVVMHGAEPAPPRSVQDFAATDLDSGGGACVGIEDRGLFQDICAQPPWMVGVVPDTEPTDCPPTLPDAAPDAHLSLEWVHGFNSKAGRQTLNYTASGEVVYPAGCLCVVLDLNLGRQRYLNGHSDLVTCLRVWSRTAPPPLLSATTNEQQSQEAPCLVASGETGRIPKVLVWSPGSSEDPPKLLASLKGFHQGGIAHVAWSPDGERIATVGATGQHCVAVYAWRSQWLLFTAAGAVRPILDLCWANDRRFVTCGVGHVSFWTQAEASDLASRGNPKKALRQRAILGLKSGGGPGASGTEGGALHFTKERGLFGKKAAQMPLLCCRPFGPELLLTGGGSGHLIVWEGRAALRSVKGHSGAVTAMHVIPAREPEARRQGLAGGLITGSTDGKLQLWNSRLELGRCLDCVPLLGPQNPLVHSCTWDEPNHKLLVAFWSAEVHEVHDSEEFDLHAGPIITGHHSHRVFGVSSNPNNANEFVTVGEDMTVRVWDAYHHRCVGLAELDTMARCVAWSPKGDLIAVGQGYDSSQGTSLGPSAHRQVKDGAFLVLKRGKGLHSGTVHVGNHAGDHGAGHAHGLAVVHEGRDSKECITCVNFSPDGSVLACGSADSCVYIYAKDRSLGGWIGAGKCRGLRGAVRGVDFSKDGALIQACDTAGFLKFFIAKGSRGGEEVKKSQDPDAQWATLKDVKWHTHSCVYGWATQGCWSTYDDGCDLRAACRSHLAKGELPSTQLLATGDSYSRVRLWRYPAATAQPCSADYRAHGGGGTGGVVFSCDNQRLMSVGREDGIVCQWQVDTSGGAPLDEACTEDVLTGAQTHDLRDTKDFSRLPAAEAANIDDRTKLMFAEERASNDDFAPVRQWQKVAMAPSRPPPEKLDEPTGSLRLQWMHGHRAGDVRQGVRYARPWGMHPDAAAAQASKRGSGNEKLITFFGGAVSAVFEAASRTMSFHREHSDEVLCSAVHPTRSLMATGQQGKTPFVLVWDYRNTLKPPVPPNSSGMSPAASLGERSPTKESLVALIGAHRRGVTHLCFSPCGRYLASTSCDDWHSLVVHDWEATTVLLNRPTSKDKVFDLAFVPPPPPQHSAEEMERMPSPPLELVQCGVNLLRFWTLSDGGHNATWQSATLGAEGQWQTFLCVGFIGVDPWGATSNASTGAAHPQKPRLNGMRTVVGCQDGSLYLFAGAQLSKEVPVHTGPVNVLSCQGDVLATGGHDGLIKIWKYADKTRTLTVTCVIDVAVHGSVGPIVRSLDFDAANMRVLTSTLAAEVFELSARDGTNCMVGGGPLLQGHAHSDLDCELHGLAPHPTSASFVTVGDDATLRIWDANKKEVVSMTSLEAPSRCVAYSPSGGHLAVGFGCPIKKNAKQPDGKWVILGTSDFGVQHSGQTDGNKPLTCCAWSPSGSILAFGSLDNKVYLYNADDGFALKGAAVAHNFPIRSVDFSKNSQYIVSNCSGFATCYVEADSGAEVKDLTKIRDVKWNSCTGPMQWATQGVWPPQADGTDVVTCDAMHMYPSSSSGSGNAHQQGVVATGDSFGRLKLWRYPVDSSLAMHKLYRAHSASSPAAWSHKGRTPRPLPAPMPALTGEGWAGLSKVRWVNGGKHLISMSGKEKVLFQWAFDQDEPGLHDAMHTSPFAPKVDPRYAKQVLGADAEPEAMEGLGAAEAAAESLLEDAAIEAAKSGKKKSKKKKDGSSKGSSAGSHFDDEDDESHDENGNEIGSVAMINAASVEMPWLSAMVEPSDMEVYGNLEATPNIQALSLERAFGVQSSPPGSRSPCLGYTSAGHPIWACGGSFVACLDKQTNSQRLFRGHAGTPVSCVAASPCGRYVASGERAARPLVRVWDAAGCVELAVLGPFHRGGVACLAWSADGRRIVSVGSDLEHSVVLWGTLTGLWEDARKLSSLPSSGGGNDGLTQFATSRPLASKLAYAPGDARPTYFATFLDPTCWGPGGLYNQPEVDLQNPPPRHPGYLFATGGVDFVKFWSAEGRTITSEKGLWGAAARAQPLLCGASAGPRLVCGSLSGHLYAFRGRACEKVLPAHEGAVGSVWASTFRDGQGGRVVSCGLEDGQVRVFNEKLEQSGTFDIHLADVPPLLSGLRAVCGRLGFGVRAGSEGSGEFVSTVLVGATSGEIYELSVETASWSLLVEGHFSNVESDGALGEAWGLDPHPTSADIVATCGDDATVRVWSIGAGRLLRKAQLDACCRCVAWSPDGQLLIVGLGGSPVPGRGKQSKDGVFVVLNALTMEVVHEARDAKHWLRDVSFAPDGQTFAIASQDATAYLYDTRSVGLRAKCTNLKGPAMRVDFSSDGAYVQVAGGIGSGHELLYFGAGDGTPFSLPSQLKNVKWGAWTARCGWPVQGCWPKTSKESSDSTNGSSGGGAASVEPSCAHRSKAWDLLAAGYGDGKVCVRRYPAIQKEAPHVSVAAHAGSVAHVKFTRDGRRLLSLGQKDRCLLVWKVWSPSEPLSNDAYADNGLLQIPLALQLKANKDKHSSSSISSSQRSKDKRNNDNSSLSGGDGVDESVTTILASASQSANGLVGSQVILHGLIERPELNGCLGVVTSFSPEGIGGGMPLSAASGKGAKLTTASSQARYTVRLAEISENHDTAIAGAFVQIKPGNLRRAPIDTDKGGGSDSDIDF